MVRNPYNITLSSTKKNIFTILLTIVIIIVGFVLMNNNGFNNTYPLSVVEPDAGVVDGFTVETKLYVINFVFALAVIIVALAIILARRDLIGIVSGFVLFAFIFFILAVGCKYTTGGIRGVNKKENITLTTMLVDRINELKG